MTLEDCNEMSMYTTIYCYNTPYIFISLCGDGIILLNQRLDFDSYIFLLSKYLKYCSTKKNDIPVLLDIDRIKKSDLDFYNFEMLYVEDESRYNERFY